MNPDSELHENEFWKELVKDKCYLYKPTETFTVLDGENIAIEFGAEDLLEVGSDYFIFGDSELARRDGYWEFELSNGEDSMRRVVSDEVAEAIIDEVRNRNG